MKTATERQVTVELVMHGQVMQYTTLPASEAREVLDRKMNKGCRWRIVLPDITGEIAGDEARYAADCEACGIPNLLDV